MRVKLNKPKGFINIQSVDSGNIALILKKFNDKDKKRSQDKILSFTCLEILKPSYKSIKPQNQEA